MSGSTNVLSSSQHLKPPPSQNERFFAAFCLGTASVLLILYGYSDSFELPAILAIISSMLCIVLVSRYQPNGLWSIPSLCLIVLCLFHFGAVPELLLDGEVFASTRYEWMSRIAGPNALWISIAGSTSFAAFAILFTPTTRTTTGPQIRTGRRYGYLMPIAFFGLAAGVALWFYYTIVLGGLNPIISPYSKYLDLSQSTSYAWVYQPIGISFALLGLCENRKLYRWSLVVFIVFAAPAFFTGFRGEVLFPLVVHFGLLAYRRKLPSTAGIFALCLIALSLISVAKEVRAIGVTSYSATADSFNPLNGLTELGFSQYVVERTYVWHAVGADPFLYGRTYSAPIERMIDRFIGNERQPSNSDFRLFNVEIQIREGGVGGSVIAEAYHNFGRAGVVIILGLWGAVLSHLASRVPSARRLLILGVVSFAFLWHVRNGFTPIPLQVAGALVIGSAALAIQPPGSTRSKGETCDLSP